MNRKLFKGRLKFKLIVALVLSLSLSMGLFALLQGTSEDIIVNHLNKTSFITKQQQETITEFRIFVTQNAITTADHEKIKNWVRHAKYINIFIFHENKMIFSTDGFETAIEGNEYLFDITLKNEPFYDVQFADTNTKVYMESYFEYKYYNIIMFFNVMVSVIFLVLLISVFISWKTSYIGVLEKEIKILEGGELHYPISIRGNDELSSLAESINEMRVSFLERLEWEDAAKTANKELITAMSHDLRTPLTALVGYLDIIIHKKYKSQDDFLKYIRNSREKAYQIKELSDKLFEYFTVFKTDEDDMQLETFNGNELINQLIEEGLFNLQNNGFQYQLNTCAERFNLDVHLISMRRVFDNLFSNILKYADKSKPIVITSYMKDRLFVISIENHINKELLMAAGTGIGIKTCKRIMERQYGHFSVSNTQDVFTVHLSLKAASVTQSPGPAGSSQA
ncbi:Signal transduction histidine kinase [Paenibacillus sp. UNCCL117]|uniref:histidine kinase dimerization/phospho-acceptor domain-containing protein n=1 Tax=unclassified Paenibacillus TaxID=185978 RepID=UPI00087FF295|nr:MULTISPECIES: histidine kinase dimerization/phospho-acceptor domain-containing protein [unclassified Paenibacillus]SDD32761.1 Signal transduction histidine kinase [Paenibacillus sp. cl123]SFW39738.1 Signal transduction histidine kinase [Paenibacillus sp. UNCCL117]